jgi:predicted transcriptional regulator
VSTAVKKTISLPPDLARDAEAMAKSEGKTLSAIIQEALREARARRRQGEFTALQRYWSNRAKELGILTEEDLERHLRS